MYKHHILLNFKSFWRVNSDKCKPLRVPRPDTCVVVLKDCTGFLVQHLFDITFFHLIFSSSYEGFHLTNNIQSTFILKFLEKYFINYTIHVGSLCICFGFVFCMSLWRRGFICLFIFVSFYKMCYIIKLKKEVETE